MKTFIRNLLTLGALLVSAQWLDAQTAPFPPKVIFGNEVLSGSNGTYSTDHYQGGGPASVTISGNAVYTGGSTGHFDEPRLLSGGYTAPDTYLPGYTIPGQSFGHYDVDSGIWIEDYRTPDVEVLPQTIFGAWIPEVWSERVWVHEGQWTQTGTYTHFAFQINSPIQPADASGTAWATVPQFGIPCLRVNGINWQFNASDTEAGGDYFSEASDSGSYLWITGSYYGGYQSQLGAFSGTRSNGYFQDTSESPVRVTPRNGDGSFLAVGSPVFGPALIWSRGSTFRFLTKTNQFEIYLDETTGTGVFLNADGAVMGRLTGVYFAAPSFFFQCSEEATFPADSGGTALPVGSHPYWGPPAIYAMNAIWRYRGSSSNADYYGGERPGQVLSIAGNGAVSYSDHSLNFNDVPGYFAGGVFQNLPVTIRGVTASGAPWTSRPANLTNYPAAVTVDSHPWYYSITESNAAGYPVYLGSQSGQVLYLNGATAYLSDPTTSTYRSGTFANGKFTFAGSAVSVKVANADGTPLDPGTAGTPGEIAGDLDVAGNHFTLGSWASGSSLLNGFTISFENNPKLLSFEAVRPLTDWVWKNATTGAGSVETLRVTSSGKVGIGTSDPAAKLHVSAMPESTA